MSVSAPRPPGQEKETPWSAYFLYVNVKVVKMVGIAWMVSNFIQLARDQVILLHATLEGIC